MTYLQQDISDLSYTKVTWAFLELPEQEAVEPSLAFMARSPGEVGDVVGIFLETFKSSMW